LDGANTLGTGMLTAGVATLSTSFTTAGTHTLTATYSGDQNFASSTSSALSQTVNLVILDRETITVTDIPTALPATMVRVNETITIMDTPAVSPAVMVALSEAITINDNTGVFPPLMISVNETVTTADTPVVQPSVLILVSESVTAADAPVLGNTPTGSNVTVAPVDTTTGGSPVTVTFQGITQLGTTSLTTSSSGTPPPAGFELGSPPVYYDIATTAAFTPPVTVCIHYTGTSFFGYGSPAPRLFHFENGAWIDRTTTVDQVNMIVCGAVPSLSPFALFAPKPMLTITANDASRQYGQANPSLNNVTYSGFVSGDGPGSLTGTPNCTTTATQVSPVGSYPITCSGQTSSNYKITFMQGTLTVTPTPLTITANSLSKVYGAGMLALGFSASGFVNGDTAASLTTQPTLSTTTTAASAVGSYPISISGAVDPNYFITYAQGTLTVTPALLTITANNATKILNAANPALTWTPSGFVNGDTASVLISNPTCTTTANTNSPVGSYPITCSGASAANYAFSYVAGTLKIQYATAIGHVIQPPINADGTSVFRQGRTIPAKFNVYDANGVAIGTPGVVSSFFLTGILSGTVTTTVEDVVDTNNPDAAFRWDGQQWIFNITTGNLSAGSTYIYTITLNDGSTIVFQFGLR